MSRKTAAVFVLQEKGQSDIVGFYALSNLSIIPGQLPPGVTKKLPTARPIPCTLLGQFAIASKWQGHGVADWLLGEILEKVLEHSQSIASFALVVDAVDQDAASYWQYLGFTPFPSTPNRLFLTMATIESIFTE